MTKSHLPYRRLVDPEIARASSAAGLRRTINTVIIIGVVAAVVVVGIIVCLLAFLYFLAKSPISSDDGLQHATSPGPAVTRAWLASTPGDFGLLLERLTSLEREVAVLKSEHRGCNSVPDGGLDHDQKSSDEETAGLEQHMQEQAAEYIELRPPSTDSVTSRKGSFSSSPQTSSEGSSITVTLPNWRTSRGESADIASSEAGSTVHQQHQQPRSKDRQPRSKDRQKQRRPDRDEPVDGPAELPAPPLEPDPLEVVSGPDDSGADNASRREKKRDRPSRGCRHCIDNDKITNDERSVQTATFQAPTGFGRAVHIQGNRNGNIPIGNDGWVRGFKTWKMAEWTSDAEPYFSLSVFGTVTVRESGLYYVYSQILFYDPNDTVGQSIYINDEAQFTCTKSNISAQAKQSTCYVGGVVRMSAGDQVGIKLSVPNVTIALYTDTSYFGLFRVA